MLIHRESTFTPIHLRRSVRFCVPFHKQPQTHHSLSSLSVNGFAAFPSMSSLGAYYELHVTCHGAPDPVTGYLLNIQQIDRIARTSIIPWLTSIIASPQVDDPQSILPQMVRRLSDALPSLYALSWQLTPYYALSMNRSDLSSVILSQQFEFSASHILNVSSLSPEKNAEIFGKCNNPLSHGHNYRLSVSVAVPTVETPPALPLFSLHTLEGIVLSTIINRFDHKHLNLESAEFRDLNPTVENITRVCFDLLATPIADSGATLHHVTVWETEKTSCTYPAFATLIP